MTLTAHTTTAKRLPDGPDAEDLPGRRHPLPDHVRVDPDAGALQPRATDPNFILGAGSDTGVWWAPSRGRRRPGRHRHRRGALPGGQATERGPRPRVRRRPRVRGRRSSLGVVSVLSVVTLRQPRHPRRGRGGPDRDRHTLAAAYDWTFLLGQSLIPAFNALLLGPCCTAPAWCRGHSRSWGSSAPRSLRVSELATSSASTTRIAVAVLIALPIAVWELSLGL